MSRCCYASPEIVLKIAQLFLEISSCLCGFAVKLCWNRVLCYVHVLAEVGFYVQFLVNKTIAGRRWTLLLNLKPARMSVKTC